MLKTVPSEKGAEKKERQEHAVTTSASTTPLIIIINTTWRLHARDVNIFKLHM